MKERPRSVHKYDSIPREVPATEAKVYLARNSAVNPVHCAGYCERSGNQDSRMTNKAINDTTKTEHCNTMPRVTIPEPCP
jgi:hypothetical protein